jgi:hypothetical protein
MLASAASRAARYREIAHRLWRVSLDQSKDIFEDRSKLATIADQLENLAEAMEDELPAEL